MFHLNTSQYYYLFHNTKHFFDKVTSHGKKTLFRMTSYYVLSRYDTWQPTVMYSFVFPVYFEIECNFNPHAPFSLNLLSTYCTSYPQSFHIQRKTKTHCYNEYKHFFLSHRHTLTFHTQYTDRKQKSMVKVDSPSTAVYCVLSPMSMD